MDGNKIISVQVDRFWNRNWRCLTFASIIALCFIVAALFFSERRARLDGLLETDWQDHWSQKDESQKASKIIFEKGPAGNGGINVQSHEESLTEYFDKEFDDDAAYHPDDHYNDRLPEQSNPETRLNKEYVDQYANEVKSAQSLRPAVPSAYTNGSLAGNRTVSILSSLFTANIKDYTLQSNFRNPFQDLTEEDMEFDADYTNPCWAESIPRHPYANNSYLRVSEIARQIDPEFQSMRKRFAARHDPATNWRLRCLPAFYVMETPPMATPSLFTVLSYHPSVVTPRLQEPEFWNKRGPDGVATLRDYVDLFDGSAQVIRDSVEHVKVDDKVHTKHKMITGDGTSSYLWMFDSWKKVKGNEGQTEPKVTAADIIYKLTPLAKFIFVLRDPSERLFQSYLSRVDDPNSAEFHNKVGEAMKKMSTCEKSKSSLWSCLTDRSFNHNLPARLRIGMYYPFIADWLRVFPRNQIKVVRFEDYVSRPSEIISEVCNFLEIPPFQAQEGQGLEQRVKITEDERLAELADHTMMSTTQAMLKKFHRKLNDELAALLEDDKFTWPEASSVPSSSVILQDSELYDDTETTSEEEEKIKEDTAKKIKEERERQGAEQQKKLNEYMEKRKQWAVQQYELQQKIVDRQKELLKEKQKQQQGQQQPQPGQQQQEQQRRDGQEQEQQLRKAILQRQQEQQQRRKQPQGQQQPQQGRPEQQ